MNALMQFKKATPPFLAVFVLVCFASCKKTEQPSSASETLPVYEVTQSGASDAQVKGLSENFRIPAERLSVQSGMVSFVDPNEHLVIPNHPATDPATMKKLQDASRNDARDAAIRYDAIDFDALRKRAVFDSAAALKAAAAAFAAAGIHLEFAKPVVGHTTFTASYKDEKGVAVSVHQLLDTRVNYEFSDKNGHLFTGPGAVVEVTYTPEGKVSHLHYAWREIKAGPEVKIIPESEVRKRITKLVPAGAKIDMKIVYWCPPFAAGPGQTKPLAPSTIIPCYEYGETHDVTNRATGKVSQMRSKILMIPATNDERYVPSARLSISDSGRSQVDARVEVQGGRPPYTYLWAGSNPAARSNTGPSINYTPIVRAVPGSNSEFRPGETFPVRERVTVTVIDANGVMMQASQVVAVNAHPVSIEKGKTASYGCQSPRDWDFMVDRTGWEDGMGTAGAGGGTQEYSWSADLSWPGDFIEPVPPGSLPATPWVNGDADYSNWGVNSAAIVLNNTDGAPDFFDANEPGATTADYGSAQLWCPATAGNNVFVKAGGFNVSYNGAWGPNGPNDNLLWLAQDCCDLLDATDGGGLTTDQRWGAAFGGLHIMTGFSTTEQVGDGSFEKDFAQNMLGVSGPAQKVLDAWFNAATTAGIGHGAAAAMGPIGMGGVTDKDDYYIGKGSRGPSLTGPGITGWWYVSQ